MTTEEFKVAKDDLKSMLNYYYHEQDGSENQIQLQLNINEKFKELFDLSNQRNSYWKYCTLSTYKANVKSMMQTYLANYIDSEEADFWKSEIEYFIKSNGIVGYEWQYKDGYKVELLSILKKSIYDNFRISMEKKLKFARMKNVETLSTPNMIIAKDLKDLKPLKIDGEKLNLAERYYLIQKILPIHDIISSINTPAQKERNKILAILLGCNIDNAKHIFNGTYPPQNNISEDRKSELDHLIQNLNIK